MPTALTTATAREDLIEATISLVADVTQPTEFGTRRAELKRMAVLTARYLNTMRLNPDTGEAQHDDLHRTAQSLLDVAVAVGVEVAKPGSNHDGYLGQLCTEATARAHAYMLGMNRLHNPGDAKLPERRKPMTEAELRAWREGRNA